MKAAAVFLMGAIAGVCATVVALSLRQTGRHGDETPVAAAAPEARPKDRNALHSGLQSRPQISGDRSPLVWSTLESTNYLTFAENLRRIGCPEETIRTLLTAEINEIYRNKRREMTAAQKHDSFWRSDYSGGRVNHIDANIARELDAERQQLLRQVLGPEPLGAEMRMSDSVAGFAVGFLDESKRQKVGGLLSKWRETEQRLLAETQGLTTPADLEAMSSLREEMRSALAGALTSDEVREFDLRNSDLSTELRARLKALRPSEAEFRDLFDIAQQASGGDVASAQGLNSEWALQRIGEVLGADRFERYLWAQDPAYSGLLDVLDRFALEESLADQVYRIKLDAQAAAESFLAQRGSDAKSARPHLEGIAVEAARRVQAAIGEKAFQSYLSHGGLWLQNLASGLTTIRTPGVTLHVTP